MSDDKVTQAAKEIDTARSNSALENLKGSLDGWRDMLYLDNGLVFLVNAVCIGVGAATVLETTGILVWVGAVVGLTGALGILDSILGRVVA